MKEVNPDTFIKAEELFITLVGDVLQIIDDGYGSEYVLALLNKYGLEKEEQENAPEVRSFKEFMEFLDKFLKECM